MAEIKRAPLSSWQTATLRLTTFHDTIDQTLLEPLYKVVVGEEPENIVKRREGFQSDGAFKDGRIVLAVPSIPISPHRVDWLYTTLEDVITFGAFEEVHSIFKDVMKRWLRDSPPVKRLAFGAIVILPVDDKDAGYQQLAAYLPSLTIDATGSSDLLYQINRPRPSKSPINGLAINRLSKWQVAVTTRALFGIAGGVPQSRQEQSTTRCQVELDINTFPQFPVILPKEFLESLLDEFGDLANEILQNGDVP